MTAAGAFTATLLGVVFILAVLPEVSGRKKLSWTVLGDWGFKIKYADKIAARAKSSGSKFWMGIGDNFYVNGVKSVKDRKWKTVFEDVYKGKWFRTHRFEVIAGNHDYKGSVKAQIDYTKKKGTSWYFPHRYYKVHRKIGGKLDVDFVYLDTTPLMEFKKKDKKQVKWLKKTLRESKAKWIIVIGHHPLYSLSGNSAWMLNNVLPVLKHNRVAAYICGHHHSLQHHVEPKMNYIVVGNTAAAKPLGKSEVGGEPKTLFRTCTKAEFKKLGRGGCMGFATMTIVGKNNMWFKFFNPKGEELYTAKVVNPRV
jgi:acid phosphatase